MGNCSEKKNTEDINLISTIHNDKEMGCHIPILILKSIFKCIIKITFCHVYNIQFLGGAQVGLILVMVEKRNTVLNDLK